MSLALVADASAERAEKVSNGLQLRVLEQCCMCCALHSDDGPAVLRLHHRPGCVLPWCLSCSQDLSGHNHQR